MDEQFEGPTTVGPVMIPADPGFNQEAWERQLSVDIATLAADDPITADAGPAAGFDLRWGVLPFDPCPEVSAADRVDRVVQIRRQMSRLQALERRELAALTEDVETHLPTDAGAGQRE